VEIIGFGTERDPEALALQTRRKRHVRNVMRREALRVESAARVSAVLAGRPDATLISASTIYNCYGLVFAARRTAIMDESDAQIVLEDDGYRDLPWDPNTWRPGDVVLYYTEGGDLAHAGLVATIQLDLSTGDSTVYVTSAWGEAGEYYHLIDYVPANLGRPARVVAQRFLYDF
jgi:hypothetical protein